MKFFVDTADVDEIKDLASTGLVDGVTTNPSIIAKSGRNFIEVIAEICDIVDGPVSAEVAATDHETMLAEGRKLAQIAGCRYQGECHALLLGRTGNPRREGGRNLRVALRRTARRYQPRRHGADRGNLHHLRQLRHVRHRGAGRIRAQPDACGRIGPHGCRCRHPAAERIAPAFQASPDRFGTGGIPVGLGEFRPVDPGGGGIPNSFRKTRKC